jgi:hypothetical protein
VTHVIYNCWSDTKFHGGAVVVVTDYELDEGRYIPEDDILHSNRREEHKSYIALTDWAL